MTDSLGTTTYQYDDMQRLISTTDVNDKTISYEYDILGRKTAQTLPDGQITEYTYDVMDRLTEVYQNDELLAEYDYNKNSQLIENNRNELKTTYEYDALVQLTELTTQKGYEDIMNFTYEYDKIGNITSEVRTEGDKTNERSYLYDSANQLINFTDNDYNESYSYDNAGNMLTKSINDVITSYQYNAGNQLVEEITDSQTIGYTYNVNGDMTEKTTGENYLYDIMGNLTSIVGNSIDQSFTYNGNGQRISKTDDGETIYYVNDINLIYEQVLQTYDDSGNVLNTYTYGIERIQSQGVDNETYLYDGRGSIVGTINQDNILESYSYTAYNELMTSSPTPNVWGYNGEDTDSKTGLQYLRARYYNPSISRFEQKDAWRGLLTENNSLNRYDYCYNNPVIYHDDGGHIPLEGVYGRGNYGRTYSSSIATVTSYRESDNTDDSDGYNFAETGIPNINNSTASNNSNLVFNPYSDVIGPEKATREQMIYICEEYARIMAEEAEEEEENWLDSTKPIGNFEIPTLSELIALGYNMAGGWLGISAMNITIPSQDMIQYGADGAHTKYPKHANLNLEGTKINGNTVAYGLAAVGLVLDLANTFTTDNGNTMEKRITKASIQIGSAIAYMLVGAIGGVIATGGSIGTGAVATIPSVIAGGAFIVAGSLLVSETQAQLYEELDIN